MPPAAQQDQTSVAQGRFTIALPAEVGKLLDELADKIGQEVSKATGVTVELSRSQVVQAVVKGAHARKDGEQA